MPKLALQPAERAALVNLAVEWYATKGKNIPAENIEKDFWVTEALRSLATPLVHPIMGSSGAPSGFLEARVVFKGGTSLSKAHGLIDRFSEDIDLFVMVTFQQDPNP